VPGLYTVRLTAGGVVSEQVVRVKEDPRIDVDPLVRRRWTERLLALGDLASQAQSLARDVSRAAQRLDDEGNPLRVDADLEAKLRDLERETQELASRLSRLRGAAEGWVAPLSADQQSQRTFLTRMLATLTEEWRAVEARLPG
jgi:hypothetical protein